MWYGNISEVSLPEDLINLVTAHLSLNHLLTLLLFGSICIHFIAL